MKKKAELFTVDKLVKILEEQGKELGYKVDSDIDYDIENIATISYLGDDNKLYLSVVVLYGGIYTKINIFDQNDKNIFSKSIRAANFDMSEYKDVIDKVYQELNKNIQFLLSTPEKIYDYGEENNWQGLDQKHYEILSQDKNLAQMAVADMRDKELEIPTILKQFRRYSMSFKEMVVSKIAAEQKMKKQINRVAKVNKKAEEDGYITVWLWPGAGYLLNGFATQASSEQEALDNVAQYLGDNNMGKYYETTEEHFNRFKEDNPDLSDEEIFEMEHNDPSSIYIDNSMGFIGWINGAENMRFSNGIDEKHIDQITIIDGPRKNAKKTVSLKKKAEGEDDLDVKLKVQKNKPAGLDTSTPKSLPESIRPLMQDLKGKISDVKEIETQLAARKAELDAKYQEAKNESKIVEKQAEIENLTKNIGKLLFAAKNETFQFQDNLVALTHQTKVVPAKATDKWKFEKVFEKLKSLMGDDNAQKFLDATLNGLQSQATEKTITELNIFSPTQKQLKTSDTSDTNKLIDTLKEIYTNLRAYFLDVKKANNILEEQLATGATASKKQNVSKKAESSYKDKIYDAIDMGGGKWEAEALVKWISEDDAERFCKIYELIDVESQKKVNLKKAENKQFVDINGKTWKEFLDNIKNEGYTFDEKLYEKEITTTPRVIAVSKDGHLDKVVAFWNDDRQEYGISCRMDA